jgi:hypothetical protein
MSKKRQNYKPSASVASAQILNDNATLVTAVSKTTATQAFEPDYSDVIKDLKRIGTLAGGFFILLVVLSFIIH